MACFLVSYDLIKRKNYPELWEALEAVSALRCLRSVWLCDVETTADGLRTYLKEHIDADDQLIIVPFERRPAAWKCRKGTSAWLAARFGQ